MSDECQEPKRVVIFLEDQRRRRVKELKEQVMFFGGFGLMIGAIYSWSPSLAIFMVGLALVMSAFDK